MVDDATTKLTKSDLLTQLGASGLLQYSGYVSEDPAPKGELDWVKTFTRMRDTSAIVGALLTAFESIIRPVSWSVEPADDTPDAQALADFIDQNLEDMDQTWEDVLSEILTMLPFGWALLEQVYKRRRGYAQDPSLSSKYDDGKIGWAKWSLRSQETRLHWQFDDNGNVLGMVQIAPPHYRTVTLPMEKCLLFRTTTRKGNPEGRSILRNAYRAYTYMEKIERLEGIGIERDLAGLPVYYVPAEMMLLAASGGSTPEAQAAMLTVQQAAKIAQNLRRDTQEGVVMPSAYDDKGNKLYDLQLLSTGGSRQFDTDTVIQRYARQIVMSVLADFIFIGHESLGSFALVKEKTQMFLTALDGYLGMIEAVVNSYAIPRLLRYNGMDVSLAPRLTHGDLGNIDLAELGGYLNAIGPRGANLLDTTDPALQEYARAAGHLPSPPPPGDGVMPEADVSEDESAEIPS